MADQPHRGLEKINPVDFRGTKAIDYALNQWTSLPLFLDDGRLEIDNHPVENAIRPTAVGKKNWFFIGEAEAGERSAILYFVSTFGASYRELIAKDSIPIARSKTRHFYRKIAASIFPITIAVAILPGAVATQSDSSFRTSSVIGHYWLPSW